MKDLILFHVYVFKHAINAHKSDWLTHSLALANEVSLCCDNINKLQQRF